MNLDMIPPIMISFLIVAVAGIAIFLTLDSLEPTLCPAATTFNSTTSGCQSPTNTSISSVPEGMRAITNVTAGTSNIFSLTPTWGTLIGVGVLLVIVSGFAFVGAMGYGAGRRKGYF